MRITPIGTCRIHTPLKRGSQRYPIALELGRNYGFVHTGAEALQLIRFLHGELEIPPEVAPLVVSGGDISGFAEQSWSPADLNVVEISSAKKLLCGDHAVQINYVYRYFADFFANRERSRTFWSLIRAGHRGDLNTYLRDERSYRLLSHEDRDLLRSISFEQQSFKNIKSEMTEIVDRFDSGTVMFVTHVNAKTPDEEIIPSRDRLIRWVKLAAEQLGVKAFDPTAAMKAAGQEYALDNGGLDLTHYTPSFSDRIYDELHRFHIAELMGAALEGGPDDASADAAATAAAHFETMLQVGDFFETSKEIHAAVARSPNSIPLIELRGSVRSRIGDFAGAVEDLTQRDDRELSQPVRIALLNALTAIEDFDRALQVATNLINDEYEDAELYVSASRAAERLGKHEQAIAFAKQSFRLNRSDLSAALQALRLLTDHGAEELVAQWREELLENLGSSSSGAFALSQWAVEHSDEELFAAAISIVDDKGAVVDLVEEAFAAGLYGAVADSVATLVGIGRLAPPLAKRRAALIENILDRSAELFESGKGNSAYRCATALAALADVPPGQLRTSRLAALAERQIREWIRDVRSSVREAEAKGPAEVIQLAEKSGDLIKADASIAVAIARALDETGRESEALSLLASVEGDVAQDQLLRRWTGRIAMNAGEYRLALEMYGSLSGDESVPAKLRAEADRILPTLRTRALRQLRELIIAERFEEALILAGSITRRTGEVDRVQRELARMYKRLRSIAVEIEKSEGDSDELERVLRLISQIRPDDQSMLRRLALELMRQFRFAEAAEVWSRVHLLAPDNESAAKALDRCETLARRRSSAEIRATA